MSEQEEPYRAAGILFTPEPRPASQMQEFYDRIRQAGHKRFDTDAIYRNRVKSVAALLGSVDLGAGASWDRSSIVQLALEAVIAVDHFDALDSGNGVLLDE